MKVAIIAGGIGGLATAIALRLPTSKLMRANRQSVEQAGNRIDRLEIWDQRDKPLQICETSDHSRLRFC
jgi:hypothetical protein